METSLAASEFFIACDKAIEQGNPIKRETRRDKEFALQDWLTERLVELGRPFAQNGRNAYPDYWIKADGRPLVGLESKGLELPGRKTFDSNSRLPSGEHAGTIVYYAFARYPKTDDAEYEVSDLVIFHADLINPPSDYVHKNKSVTGFGGYADVMIRDRKMYVLRTPYTLLEGLDGAVTLIVPAGEPVADELEEVGTIERIEADESTVAYRFDLRTNALNPEKARNTSAGRPHTFTAYQRRATGAPVELRPEAPIEDLEAEAAASDDEE